jgi:hypothetical protein
MKKSTKVKGAPTVAHAHLKLQNEHAASHLPPPPPVPCVLPLHPVHVLQRPHACHDRSNKLFHALFWLTHRRYDRGVGLTQQ